MKRLLAETSLLCVAVLCVPALTTADVEVRVESRAVPRYGRAEFTLSTEACPGNPFDPAEIDVALQITLPDGQRLELPCFHYQDYERRRVDTANEMRDWLYPVGDPVWKARFAPTKLGTHTVRAIHRCAAGTTQSQEVSFECTPSDSNGFIRVSERNPRYFEFTGGEACFFIGENLAFVKDTFRQEELLQKLGTAGGNFARVWACCIDWGMSLEGRKSAWGRSWMWDPPIAPEPGGAGYDSHRLCVKLVSGANPEVQVSPSHPVALRPETGYVVTGRARTGGDAQLSLELSGGPLTEPIGSKGKWAPLKGEFTSAADQWWLGRMTLRLNGDGTASLADLSLREAAGGPELLWEADVNRPVLGRLNLYDCYMLDTVVEAAERTGVYLQVVVLPRDPYWEVHPSLKRGGQHGPDYDRAVRDAQNLLRYAVARWGYSTSIAAWEYFNEIDPASPTDRFYGEVGKYLEQVDVYRHPRVTSAWGPSPKDWRHARLDAINLHHYIRPVEGEPWHDEVVCLLNQIQPALSSEHRKPVLMAEFGLADERWGLSPYLKQDEALVHLHNTMWASALSGLAGTVMPWWWDELDRMNVYQLFTPLAAFVSDIPYTTADLRRIAVSNPEADPRIVGLQADDAAYLWIANPKATWWNVAIQDETLTERSDATVQLDEMAAGTYAVEWWDTRTGEVTRGEPVTHAGGGLELRVPSFTQDIACKVVPTTG